MTAKEFLKSKGLKNPPLDSGVSGGGDAPRMYASDCMEAYADQIKSESEATIENLASRVIELERQLNTQAKHKESLKQYWLLCSESKSKLEEAIKEHFDGGHIEIKTFEDFKYQFDLD